MKFIKKIFKKDWELTKSIPPIYLILFILSFGLFLIPWYDLAYKLGYLLGGYQGDNPIILALIDTVEKLDDYLISKGI